MKNDVMVLGSFIVDLMARASHLPVPGETVKGSRFQIGPGGKGFNQAVAAFKAGAMVHFSTKLGMDAFAQIALDMMEKLGMDDSYVFRSTGHETGSALIMVGENTSQNEIIVVPGACLTITAEEVEKLKDTIAGSKYMLMQLEINTDAIQLAAEYAVKNQTAIILNPAPAEALAEELWSLVDIAVPNEVEAEFYSGIPVDSEESAAAAAEWFHRRGVKHVIITLAERGTYYSGNGEHYLVPAFSVQAVDTTGAGDAFCGGLLAALSEDYPMRDAIRFASAVAALSVQRIGTAPAMPDRRKILDFLATIR